MLKEGILSNRILKIYSLTKPIQIIKTMASPHHHVGLPVLALQDTSLSGEDVISTPPPARSKSGYYRITFLLNPLAIYPCGYDMSRCGSDRVAVLTYWIWERVLVTILTCEVMGVLYLVLANRSLRTSLT